MQVLEPRGANERLDPQSGEAQHQMWFPQSFVLIDTIPNPIGASTLGEMSKKTTSSIPRSKAPTSLIGAAKAVCQAPLFFVETLAISSTQLVVMFRLVASLCENGGTPEVMVRSEDTFVLLIIHHPISKANRMKVSKVQPKSWHVVMAKVHDLPTWLAIYRANVIPRVMVVHIEEGVVYLKRASALTDPLVCCWILVFNH
jgi:hypothetical protein